MADRLYLSLWYPNFRLEALPAALVGVLRQFAVLGSKRVSAASAYPIDFTEAATYQRIYVQDERADPESPDVTESAIETAVAEATEQLHDDMAFEFEMRWQLWAAEPADTTYSRLDVVSDAELDEDDDELASAELDTPWRLRTHTVRVLGFGPSFDVAGFEQNGHILADFGLDTPWTLETLEDDEVDEAAQGYIQQNVEKLLAFTLLVEKHCGISSRLLWTESGEPLAEKLIARLQRVN